MNIDQLRSIRVLCGYGPESSFQDRLNHWQAGQDIKGWRVLENLD